MKKISEDLVTAAKNLEKMKLQTVEWFEKNKFQLLRRNTIRFYGAGEMWIGRPRNQILKLWK